MMKRVLIHCLLRGLVHWLLVVVSALFLVSGFGISYFRTVETLTFGLLTKNLAFRIHSLLWLPFIVLLLLHILQGLVRGRKREVAD